MFFIQDVKCDLKSAKEFDERFLFAVPSMPNKHGTVAPTQLAHDELQKRP